MQFSISIVFIYTQLNVKTVLFQTVQFSINTVSMPQTILFQTNPFQTIQFSVSTVSMSKSFYFKQFSLAKVLCLNVKTVLFQAIHLCMSTQFSSI